MARATMRVLNIAYNSAKDIKRLICFGIRNNSQCNTVNIKNFNPNQISLT